MFAIWCQEVTLLVVLTHQRDYEIQSLVAGEDRPYEGGVKSHNQEVKLYGQRQEKVLELNFEVTGRKGGQW